MLDLILVLFALAILLLAVVAVFVCVLVVGFTLWPLAGMSLAACLLLGAVVGPTDPAAAVGVFRDIGAPRRSPSSRASKRWPPAIWRGSPCAWRPGATIGSSKSS